MTTITLPPEIEKPLVEAARRQGTTPEQLAVESLRRLFLPPDAIAADTEVPLSVQQMALAYQALGRPAPDADAESGVDLDAYPLY